MKHKLWIRLSLSAACALCLIIYSMVGCPAQALAYGGGTGIVDPSRPAFVGFACREWEPTDTEVSAMVDAGLPPGAVR
jgi:hypothetical protein